ncbi:hydroxyacylglutathione hydrolase-like protein [Ceratitis capitata]|uniref:hydroxyacylglutathione hydrolase n=1 Tax=Ceratitis capitata TaxID=7213 RepID=W8BK60_CERCA|nr:hydroxyacylglutathione hydrolase-like protein [Ceratitis capitata]
MYSLFGRGLAHKIYKHACLAQRLWTDKAAAAKPPAAPDKLHSQIVDVRCEGMVVKILPARDNNYMYLITDLPTGCTAAIDLSDNKLLFETLKKENLTLSYAFITHHHEDHAGGTEELAAQYPDVKICAGDERIKCVTHCVKNDEKLKLGEMTFNCMHTPCHTVGHYCFFVECGAGGPPALFTGDTLFQGGCGGFGEGTPEQMVAIVDRFMSLPKMTRVFGGHENTIANLRFAQCVEPENSNVSARLMWAQKQRENKLPTPPSLLCEEMCFNPFLRIDHPDVQNYAGDTDPIYVMFCLRKQRDAFK